MEGEKEDTYIGKEGPREERGRVEGRTEAEVVGCIVAGLHRSWDQDERESQVRAMAWRRGSGTRGGRY